VNNTPAKSLPTATFYTLAGVDEAHCDGSQLSGKWSDLPHELDPWKPGTLVEEFANWPDNSESISKFTRKYGPLQISHSLNADGAGAPFHFSLESWRKEQHVFQAEWQLYFKFRDTLIAAKQIYTAPMECFVLTGSGLKFKAANLLRLLFFSLDGVPVERLRLCMRPNCTHPYFLARHLKQNYCSDECARWGQRKWKKQWWAEHGNDWRAKRRETDLKKTKRGKPRRR